MTVLRNINDIFNRPTKIKLSIIMAAIMFGGLLEMLALSLVAPLISVLLDSSAIETNSAIYFVFNLLGFRSAEAFLAMMIFSLAGIYLFRGLYFFVLTKIKQRFLARRQAQLSNQILKKLLSYSYLYHTSKNPAELHRTVLTDVAEMFGLIGSVMALASELFMTVFILVFLMVVSPVMTLSVVALAAVCLLLNYTAFRKQIKIAGDQNREAFIGMTKSVNQSIGGIKEVKLLGRENFFSASFKKFSDIFVKVNAKFYVLNAVPKLLVESVCFSGAFVLLGILHIAGVSLSEHVPQISVFVLAAFRMLPGISRQVHHINAIIYRKPSVEAVHKALDDFDINETAAIPAFNVPKVTKDIIVSGVTFRYPGIDAPVLKNVSLTIPERQSVAFIGASGAGKTTLADLILGILTPESGGIYYNGMSVHHDFAKWRHFVGYIPQQIYLLDESILANVAFGIDSEKIDESKVWRALEQAQLADYVRFLPEGLKTVVGDRGVRLSGGQRQRIGIARAIYEDPPILVLDEATSSLDNDTEKAVMEAVMGFRGSKTLIIVAHRLSTIEHCNIVYRVEGMNVTEVKE